MRSHFAILFRNLRRHGARFFSATAGNVTVTFALALIPVAGAVGAAVDYSNANKVRTHLQASLDAAVLAGGGDTSANRITTATNSFNSNFVVSGITSTPSFIVNGDGTFSGTASAVVKTSFGGLIGFSTVTVRANSKAAIAVAASTGKAYCVVSLNGTAQKGLGMSGSAQVNAPNCIVQVNSNHASDAVDMSGSTKIASAENCFVGKLKAYSSSAVSPSADASCSAMADPFASMTKPTVGACDHTNYQPVNNETLQPGVYCGGLNISSKTVTFAPGLYIIKNGLLQPSGGSKMTGSGVSFFLTGTGAGIQTSGGSAWHVSAMTTGPLAGFVFFLDPTAGPAGNSELSGTSELYFEGVIYLPKQMLKLSGGSTAFTASPFTAYIADTYDLSSSSALNINSDPTKTSVPIPSALKTGSTGGYLRLVN